VLDRATATVAVTSFRLAPSKFLATPTIIAFSGVFFLHRLRMPDLPWNASCAILVVLARLVRPSPLAHAHGSVRPATAPLITSHTANRVFTVLPRGQVSYYSTSYLLLNLLLTCKHARNS
jgi:hypothetical protein